tara:strand:- start:735 stop:1817 length:1083 start_codon:yes stop_codon:yes gene_type:complete
MNHNIFINKNLYKGGSKISYPIKLKSNYKKIPVDLIQVNICVYRINKEKHHYKPFLQYLLYKFDKPEIFSFPFKKIRKNENPKKIADNLVSKILNKKFPCKGYLMSNEKLYFFYEDTSSKLKINKKYRDDTYWWCLIDEICNHNKIINFPIHIDCYQLFYKHPSLIYLKQNKKNIDIPIIGYYGDTIELIDYVSALGLRASQYRTFGPYYYFTSYVKAIAWGGWTSNYKKRIILDKKITDENGKYKQGGIIRFALFLNKNYVVLYQKNNIYYDLIHDLNNADRKNHDKKVSTAGLSKWTNDYDSLILGNIKYTKLSGYFNINTEIILKNFNQQIGLSTHLIDTKSLKTNWDPLYENYLIK